MVQWSKNIAEHTIFFFIYVMHLHSKKDWQLDTGFCDWPLKILTQNVLWHFCEFSYYQHLAERKKGSNPIKYLTGSKIFFSPDDIYMSGFVKTGASAKSPKPAGASSHHNIHFNIMIFSVICYVMRHCPHGYLSSSPGRVDHFWSQW